MQYSYFREVWRTWCQPKNIDIETGTISNWPHHRHPKYVNHPVVLAYRFDYDGKSICFLTDVEPYRDVLYNGICLRRRTGRVRRNPSAGRFPKPESHDFTRDTVYIRLAVHHESMDGKIDGGTSMEDSIEMPVKAMPSTWYSPTMIQNVPMTSWIGCWDITGNNWSRKGVHHPELSASIEEEFPRISKRKPEGSQAGIPPSGFTAQHFGTPGWGL